MYFDVWPLILRFKVDQITASVLRAVCVEKCLNYGLEFSQWN